MKNIVLFFLIFLPTSAFCQYFVVTPKGLRNANDTSKTYVVVTIDSLTTEQIFRNSVNYIQKVYNVPNNVVRGQVPNKFLKYITSASNVCKIWKDSIDVSYVTSLTFKERKIRYEINNIELFTYFYSSTDKRYYSFVDDPLIRGIFNKNGEVKEESAKRLLEDYFNNEFNFVVSYLNGSRIKKEEW